MFGFQLLMGAEEGRQETLSCFLHVLHHFLHHDSCEAEHRAFRALSSPTSGTYYAVITDSKSQQSATTAFIRGEKITDNC